ncbi:hypothetical protein [Herbaspirillum sp. B65]|uniref:hypothetical protein n=1 Tax=Herbaspirillum sp. B65 TaxID=137708 RepID=UPI00131F42DC|nr:hypothetical protein [Herbaspirillum sp. B65]
MTVFPHLLNALTEHCGRRPLAELSNESGQSIDATFSVILDGSVTNLKIFSQGLPGSNHALAHIKIVLKPRSELGKFSFSVECLIRGLSSETGFSGFTMAGKISTNDELATIDIKARTNRYNVWNWRKEFQF